MKAIVAIDGKSAIGYQGKLLYHLHEDMAHFNKLTTGNTIIYGINTLETFPDKQPLKNRRNIILTSKNIEIPNALVCHSVHDVLTQVNICDEIYVIGGSRTYHDFYNFIDTIYVTQIYDTSKPADAFFVDLNLSNEWYIYDTSELMKDDIISFKFLTYRRKTIINNCGIVNKMVDILSNNESFRSEYYEVSHNRLDAQKYSSYSTLIDTLQNLLTELEGYRTN